MWPQPKSFANTPRRARIFEIKAGFVEGKAIDAKEVQELAKMPPKEVLVAKVLGGLNAPISGFANVLSANLRGLVVALNAIAEKRAPDGAGYHTNHFIKIGGTEHV